jgi:hypothetical protein
MSEAVRTSESSRWQLVTADIGGLSAFALDDGARLGDALRAVHGVEGGAATWLENRYALRGVSLVGSGSRFRLVVHTWPEHGMATLDLSSPESSATEQLRRYVDAVVAFAGGDGAQRARFKSAGGR